MSVGNHNIGPTLDALGGLVERMPTQLFGIDPQAAADKPEPSRWSKKEELGHLIDSAFNNHVRIMRVQSENDPALPDYDGDAWVRLQQYQQRFWDEMIDLWHSSNRQLLQAALRVSNQDWSRSCRIGNSESCTLAFLVQDYLRHLLGHLRHIGVQEDAGPEKYPERPAPVSRPIAEVLRRRWSPRLFDERLVEREKILTVLEAARWAPSCFNEQPWRYLVFDSADRNALEQARDCLLAGNAWARGAPVLMLSAARDTFARNSKLNRTAQHDVGLASENMALQAVAAGLAFHQMAGFDLDRARTTFQIPDGFTPLAMIAVGYPRFSGLQQAPEQQAARELAPRERKSVAEIAFAGQWGHSYA